MPALSPLVDDPLIRSLLAPLRRPGHFQRRYNLKGERFEGGQGYVVRFRDEEVGRDVAVKRPLHWPPPATMSPEQAVKLLARFLNEARMTGQLQHPSIVPIYEVGVDDHDTPYYVMKWVEGESLERKMTAQDRIARDALIGTLLRVAEALSYAHEHGVIHRDLKPSNVMVGEHGVVYLMDWGLAKRVSGLGKVEATEEEEAAYTALIEGHAGTLAGRRAGTPGYMSPEQARGDLGAVGPRSDVYGVGAMIYHALMSHAPYMDEEASSLRDTSVGGARRLDTEQLSALQKRLQERIERGPPKAITRRGVPEELVAICERAMAYRQGDRYATMAELARDLKAYLEQRVVSAYETGTWAETKKWVQRNKALAGAMGAVFVAVVGGALILRLQANKTQAANTQLLVEKARAAELTADVQSQFEIASRNLRAVGAMTTEFMSSIAGSSGLVLVPRDAWCSKPPILGRMEQMGEVTRITYHHSASDLDLDASNLLSPRDVVSELRRIYEEHTVKNGWGDVGFHYAISPDGRVWECRSMAWKGAHVGGGNNEGNIGIVLLGEFSEKTPTPQQLVSALLVNDILCSAYGVDVAHVFLHRDLTATLCPGDRLSQILMDLRIVESHGVEGQLRVRNFRRLGIEEVQDLLQPVDVHDATK